MFNQMKKILLAIFFIVFVAPQEVFSEVVHISLDDAVALALEKNLDLKAKRKKIEELKQDIKIANALKNPQFQSNFLMGKVTRGNSSQFGLYVPVEIAKRGVRKKVAQINLKIAEDEIRAAEHNLKIKIMRSYFNVLYMKSVVIVLKQREALFRGMKAISDKHEEHELHTSIDILQNDMKYKRQLVLLNQAKANLLGAQFVLNDAMNIEGSKVMYDTLESSLFLDDLAILNINLLPYQTIEDTAMEFSYALSIAESNIEKKSVEVVLAKRKRIPDVTIGGGYAYQTANQTKGMALPGAFVAAGLELPMLYTFTPDIKKARIVYDRAQVEKDSFENHLKFALKEDYNNFKYAKENIGHYKNILKDSMTILQDFKRRYENGEVTLLNMIQVENAHQENIKDYIGAVQIYYDAYLNLMQNVGHDILLDDDM